MVDVKLYNVNRAIIWRGHTDCMSGTCGRRHTMRSGDPAIESVTPRLLVCGVNDWRRSEDAPTWLEAAARASTAVSREIIWREHTDYRSGTCGRRHAMRSGDPAIESLTPRLLVWRKRPATTRGHAYVARGSSTRVNGGQ